MSFLTFLISFFVFAMILIAIFWVGIYVVLPVVLFFMLVSAIVSLVGSFSNHKHGRSFFKNHTKQVRDQVIDVEYEEIK